MKKCNFHLAALCFVFSGILRADVKLPAILSDNMCLQSGKAVTIWGTADPGEKVGVSFAGQRRDSVTDASCKWKVVLEPLKASDVPNVMTVAGKNTVTITNVVVGSVWVCSGQSNMELGMRQQKDQGEIAKTSHPRLRLFIVKKTVALDPASDVPVVDTPEDFSGKWVECSPESVVRGGWNGFSAVGYFFGREILEKTGQPVGMIDSSWGGTPVASWISYHMLQKNQALHVLLKWVDGPKQAWPGQLAKYQSDKVSFSDAHRKWEQEVGPEYLKALSDWKMQAKQAASDKKPAPPKPQSPKLEPKLDEPKLSQNIPTGLFNGMITPLLPYAIQGVIWYQGESDAMDPVGYRDRFPALINDWREHWSEGNFPFLFVQLANYKQRLPDPSESHWALLREAQSSALKLPETGMATIIDIGAANDIHPGDKADVGRRLSLLAAKKAFGANLVDSGPRFTSMSREGSKATLSFTNIGGGLMIGAPPPDFQSPAPLSSTNTTTGTDTTNELKGFSVAGDDHQWKWACASIHRDKVIVWSDLVPKPAAVRYAWADNPECNLYNKEGLPAEPFRTDSWITGEETQKPAPSRHEQKVKAVRSGHYDLVLVGDSITETLETRYDLKPVWAKYYAPRNALNLGYSGYRTENILTNLKDGELDFKESPKVFVLLIGTNDTDDQHYQSVHSAEEVLAGIKAIVDLIRQKHPSSVIIVKRPYPCGVFGDESAVPNKYGRSPKMAAELKRAGELIKSLADDKNIYWIDVGGVFLKPDGKIDPSLMPDLVHPNAAGASAAAKALEPLLSKLLGDKPILD